MTGPRQTTRWDQTAKEIAGTAKENQIAIAEASKIIKDGINEELFTSILGKRQPHMMWARLQSVCSQVGQGVIYSILQELLAYSKNNPSSGYNKISNAIFASVRLLPRRLRATITSERDICDSLANVVALDSFYEDFVPTIAALNQGGEKSMNEIQAVLLSEEAKLWSKYITGVTNDLAMMFRRNLTTPKKATKEDECYNCHKMRDFARNCRSLIQPKSKLQKE